MNEYARRRAAIGDALRSAGGPALANNVIARSLHVSVVVVRRVRRQLEASGAIRRVYLRMSRRGYYVDVARVCENGRSGGLATP